MTTVEDRRKAVVRALSVQEFSILAGVSPKTVKRWLRAGKLPSFRLGERVVRIPGEAAEEILTKGFPGKEKE